MAKFISWFMRPLCWFLILSSLVSTLSFRGRGNPLEALLWSFKERPSFYNRPSINHYRTFSCAGRKGQLYPDLSARCHNYYRCLGGVAYSYMCPEGETFDMDTQECRPEEEMECPRVPPTSTRCWHQPDGFYPDYEDDCTTYYSCYNGSVDEEGKCLGSAIWDSATASCGIGQDVVCSPPSCLGLKEGFYPLPGSLCSAYYSCSNGFRTDMLCPYGTIFDYMKKQCVAGTDSVCYERACEGRVNGLYAEPRAPCNTFYRCFNGAMVQLEECPTEQIFDGHECVQKTNFSCLYEGKGSCADKTDGTYSLEEDTQCRGFFVCKNRQAIRKFQCNVGLSFDGQKCVNSSNYICTAKRRVPNCTKKFDGYYTLEGSDCKKFFKCRDAKKVSEHTCPGKYVFDGHQCISPLFFACSTKSVGMNRSLPIKGVYKNSE